MNFPGGNRVYPRPHGEASLDGSMTQPIPGLSPPTRGSHRRKEYFFDHRRSIPAHTGKPSSWPCRRRPPWVYPRPHGEAINPRRFAAFITGLSPPTRGSQPPTPDHRSTCGSIHAHTGKPKGAPGPCWRFAVYPRPHGEAERQHELPRREPGLSPPTRGSLAGRVDDPADPGSIPAHTGKPSSQGIFLRS